jgi:hypothetical protein
MNLNIVKYLAIWVYVNIIMWISYMNLNHVWIFCLWILYEFEFEKSHVCFSRFKCILNMWLLNGVDWLKVADTIDASLVSSDLSHMTLKILWLTLSIGLWCRLCWDSRHHKYGFSYQLPNDSRHQRRIFGVGRWKLTPKMGHFLYLTNRISFARWHQW